MKTERHLRETIRVPINKTAARVTSKAKEHQLYDREVQRRQPTKAIMEAPPPHDTTHPMQKIRDLIGSRSGMLTVVGYVGHQHRKGAKMLVKCDCGLYEYRYASSLRREKQEPDRCSRCDSAKKNSYIASMASRGVDTPLAP